MGDKLPPTHGDDSSVLGGRVPRTQERRHAEGPPDGFELFCSYYLGITPDDRYQKPSIEEIARRHGMTPAQIKELLVEHNLDPQKIRDSSFDMEGAVLDIKLAPAGLSRTEIARGLYDEVLEAVAK